MVDVPAQSSTNQAAVTPELCIGVLMSETYRERIKHGWGDLRDVVLNVNLRQKNIDTQFLIVL